MDSASVRSGETGRVSYVELDLRSELDEDLT
jgi:hypothetical protein